MREIKAYHCGFCKKVLVSKTSMKKHEQTCPRNPETHSCGTCGNFFIDPDDDERIPRCRIGKMTACTGNRRNPYGMKSNCESYRKNPYCEL